MHLQPEWKAEESGPEVIKLPSCSTQLSTKFRLLIKAKIPTNEEVSCFKSLIVVFIMLINVKMPTIVGILTFMSRINFVLSSFEHGQFFKTSGPDQLASHKPADLDLHGFQSRIYLNVAYYHLYWAWTREHSRM